MASACLNRIGIPSDNFLERETCPSYTWFSHRLSISREEDTSKSKTKHISSPVKHHTDLKQVSDPVNELSDLNAEQDFIEFEGFGLSLDDSVIMLPADELFSEGKLVPLQLSDMQQPATSSKTSVSSARSPDTPCSGGRRTTCTDNTFSVDPYLFSPRAPRCSSRWKELLGFGKLQQSSNNIASKVDGNKNKRTSISSSSSHGIGAGSKSSIRQLFQKGSRSSSDSSNNSSVNVPLLKEADSETVSVSSRLSLSSSSSSGHDLDDLPRFSLDSDKCGKVNNLSLTNTTRPKTRLVRTKIQPTTEAKQATRPGRSTIRRSAEANATAARGLSVDSPRMNSSGKIVFQSLERSSSSPSTFNGGPRYKHRGMERSYSANVRVTPVLNVPVCSKSGSMFGFPIFSQQKQRDGSNGNNGGSNRSQRFNKSRTSDCS